MVIECLKNNAIEVTYSPKHLNKFYRSWDFGNNVKTNFKFLINGINNVIQINFVSQPFSVLYLLYFPNDRFEKCLLSRCCKLKASILSMIAIFFLDNLIKRFYLLNKFWNFTWAILCNTYLLYIVNVTYLTYYTFVRSGFIQDFIYLE